MVCNNRERLPKDHRNDSVTFSASMHGLYYQVVIYKLIILFCNKSDTDYFSLRIT